MNDLAVVLFVSLLCHLWGDYVLQSDAMAFLKRKNIMAALVHAVCYTLPFFVITRDPVTLLVIGGTHMLIDRFGAARYIVYLKNFIAPRSSGEIVWWHSWKDCNQTGYHKDKQQFLSVWLLIIADNTLHLTINTAVLILRHHA